MVKSARAHDQHDMRLHNRALVWDSIYASRPVSRAQLAKMTSMSPTSITRIVGELAGFGLLVEYPDTQNGVGRKATLLNINQNALFSFGIDVDVDTVQTCLLDLDNQPRAMRVRAIREKGTAEAVIEAAFESYREILADANIGQDKVKAVGVSVAGTVDQVHGVVKASPQLHWRDIDLRTPIESRFGLPAVFENDVKAAIYEEYTRHGECRAENIAYLTIGSGIGAALMYGGQILRGGSNAAGEIGHITVQPGGEPCDCGRHGCLYTCLSEAFLLKKIRRLSDPSAGIEDWVDAHREGAAWATGLSSEVAGYIAMALNQVLCSYDPQVVIVGGRLMYSHPDLLGLALDKKGFIYEAIRSDASIIRSVSASDDAVIGAAILAKAAYLDRLLKDKENMQAGF
jgi:predicted NBD/HSP70 family sugar kinase